MEEKEINQILNDYIVKNKLENNIIFDYIEIFYLLAKDLNIILKDFCEHNIIYYNIEDFAKMTVQEKIDMIKDFYKEYNIDLDVEKLMTDGTIEFYEQDINNFSLRGINYYENVHKLINVTNNGVIADVPILVHELSHFRNQPDNDRCQVNDLFTEGLALVDEYLFLDYLENLGYIEEVKNFKIYLQKCIYANSKYAEPVLKVFLLYKTLGNVTKESYEILYKNSDDYEEVINITYNEIISKKFSFSRYVWYFFNSYISSYMYSEYHKNNDYILKIQELNKIIDSNDLILSLKTMGLIDFGKKDRKKILDSVKEFLSSITEEKTKTK